MFFFRKRANTTVLLALVAVIAVEARSSSTYVDTSDALVIGQLRLSGYRVDKQFQRAFAGQIKMSGAPSTADVRDWFARFLAEQVLTAQALHEGYGDRPEVLHELSRMEHHMLTQYAGPFYEHLYAKERASGPPMAQLKHPLNNYDVELLRVPKAAPIARKLDRISKEDTTDAISSEILDLAATGQAEYFSGNLAWPFEPFDEIAEAIGNGPTGKWQLLDAENVRIAFLVRNVHTGSGPTPYIPGQESLIMEHRVQSNRRRQVLAESNFELGWTVAQQLVDRIVQLHPDSLLPLSKASFSDLLSAPIASYRDRDGAKEISVDDYISYFNDLFLRRFAGKSIDILDAAQSIVLGRYDEVDARAIGIDQDPKFIEDRINYRDLLALDLYQKERVRPMLAVNDDAIARYYESHKDSYTRATRIEGDLLTFDDMKDAELFAQASDAESAKSLAKRASKHKKLLLTPDTKLAEIDFLPDLVFSKQASHTVGPFPSAGAFGVWVTIRVVDSETQSLSSVRTDVRSKLEQPLLYSYESDLARKISRGIAVVDKISYSKFGVSGSVAKPWDLQ